MNLTLTKQEKILGGVYLLLYVMVLPFLVSLVCVLAGITSETTINLICFFLNAALALVFFRKLLKSSWRVAKGNWKHTIATALKGFGLYWLINFAVTALILTLDPEFGNVNDANINTMLAESPLLMTIAVVVMAPLAEECLFRGWMFLGLAEKSVPLAYIVTCGFFSAAHVVGYIGLYEPTTLLLCFLQYLGPSVVLCRTCRKGGGLMAPLLLHMSINALSCLLMR